MPLNQLSLSIAGIDIELVSPTIDLQALAVAWRGFVGHQTQVAPFTINVKPWAVEPSRRDLTTPPESDGQCIEQPRVFSLRYAKGGDPAQLEVAPTQMDGPVGQGPAAIRGAITAFVACALTDNDGLLLHGAGIKGPKGAGIFTGPSGAGKSTLCSLCADERVLNDELIAVRFDEAEGAFLHSTPFFGSHRLDVDNQKRPLVGAFLLAQTDTIQVSDLGATETFDLIARSIVLPTGHPVDGQAYWKLVEQLTAAVPWRVFGFPRQAEPVIRALDSLLV